MATSKTTAMEIPISPAPDTPPPDELLSELLSVPTLLVGFGVGKAILQSATRPPQFTQPLWKDWPKYHT